MIYDYKSDEIVQDCIVEDLSPIIEDIETEYEKLRRDECIGIYAPSSIVKEILCSLLEYSDDTFIEESEKLQLFLNNKNSILLTVFYDGELFIEDAYNGKLLVSCEGVINYIHDSFKKSEIDEFAKDESPVLVFGFKEEPIEKSDCKCSCKCKFDCKEYSGTDDGFPYHEHERLVIKCDLDLDEAHAKLDEMEAQIERMSDMLFEMNHFAELLR